MRGRALRHRQPPQSAAEPNHGGLDAADSVASLGVCDCNSEHGRYLGNRHRRQPRAPFGSGRAPAGAAHARSQAGGLAEPQPHAGRRRYGRRGRPVRLRAQPAGRVGLGPGARRRPAAGSGPRAEGRRPMAALHQQAVQRSAERLHGPVLVATRARWLQHCRRPCHGARADDCTALGSPGRQMAACAALEGPGPTVDASVRQHADPLDRRFGRRPG